MTPFSLDSPVLDSVLPYILKAAMFLSAAVPVGVALDSVFFEVQAIHAVYIFQMILEPVVHPCIFAHQALSFLCFWVKENAPSRSRLREARGLPANSCLVLTASSYELVIMFVRCKESSALHFHRIVLLPLHHMLLLPFLLLLLFLY